MKQEHSVMRSGMIRLTLATVVAVVLGSCAVDGYDDSERFSSGVTGQTLVSPAADSITFTANADGSMTTIQWPVVYGAGGFLCSVYDVSDEANPVALVSDSVIDGNTMRISRTEDTNYELRIKTLGNAKLDNADASEATVVAFNSFTPAWKTLPDGTDLYQWFQENPLPETADEVVIDLAPNGKYTMSGSVDFLGSRVTLRTTNKNERATIAPGNGVSFQAYNGLSFKNLIFDCTNSTKPLILLSATPSETIKNLVSFKGIYYIEQPFVISNCLIDNLANEVLNNNKVSYCIKTFLVDNSVFHFNTGSDMSSATYFNMYTASYACINDFKARLSTFYNTSAGTMKYFIRYNNGGGPKSSGYSESSVTLQQCTVWNIVPTNQFSNYDGMKRTDLVTFTLDRNIIANTGSKQFVRRYIAGANWSDAGVKKFTSNTYVFDGADAWTMPDPADPTTWTGEASYDRSGTILSGDPGFKDASNGDFTVSGANQLSARTGDPRWLPEQ